MNIAFRLPNTFVAFVFLLLGSMAPSFLLANDHGGGSGAPAPLVFTVNLARNNYLQLGLILEAASPEVSHELIAYNPKIQHEIILLLSGKDGAKLRTLPGKKELIEEIIEAVNHVIHKTEKNGVSEVLFTAFVIQ